MQDRPARNFGGYNQDLMLKTISVLCFNQVKTDFRKGSPCLQGPAQREIHSCSPSLMRFPPIKIPNDFFDTNFDPRTDNLINLSDEFEGRSKNF